MTQLYSVCLRALVCNIYLFGVDVRPRLNKMCTLFKGNCKLQDDGNTPWKKYNRGQGNCTFATNLTTAGIFLV